MKEINARLKITLNKDIENIPLKDWQIEQFLKELTAELSRIQFTARFICQNQLDPNVYITDITIKRRRKREKKS